MPTLIVACGFEKSVVFLDNFFHFLSITKHYSRSVVKISKLQRRRDLYIYIGKESTMPTTEHKYFDLFAIIYIQS